MPPGTRSFQSTQQTRTHKRRQGRRVAQESEDEQDDAPTNTQGIDDDDDLNQIRGVNNEVVRGKYSRYPRDNLNPPQEADRKARDLVRLALFSENRRVPLKREEISKKGMR
jgi:hypothetical protein